MQPAIRVEHLGKRYKIGLREEANRNFREALVDLATAPLRRLRGLREHANGDDIIWALKDVSFEVQPGEVVGIIGRNGAGKTTLLKILSRITEPTEGRVQLGGRVASLLEVGTGFHPELTGRENIYLNGAILGMKKAEIDRKFDEIVAFAETEKFLDTPVKRYSSGMYVRLAFAVAAHLEPDILIVDEVLAVGDAVFQKRCLGKMKDVATGGRTVLLVTHNLAVVRALCTRAVWLTAGRIEEHGRAPIVTDHYLLTSAQKTTGKIDLLEVPRRSISCEQLRLLRIEFNDGHPIRHGEPLTARLEYDTFSELHDVAFGIGINSLDGVRILSMDTDLENDDRRAVSSGARGVIEMYLDRLDLQPGVYRLDVAARSGMTHSLDYLPDFGQIEVLPGPRTANVIIRTQGDGGVRMPAKWAWHFS